MLESPLLPRCEGYIGGAGAREVDPHGAKPLPVGLGWLLGFGPEVQVVGE